MGHIIGIPRLKIYLYGCFNRILTGGDLFGGENKALDGSKIRAQNSKKNNISEEKIDKRTEHHQNKFDEYAAAPEQADRLEREGKSPDLDPDALLSGMEEADQRILKLEANGTVYDKRGRNGNIQSRFRRYSLPWPVCANCPYEASCLSDQNVQTRHGRHIERNIYEQARLDNRKRVINGRATYKRRPAIVEHPFGTIKRSWGYYYTLLKGREKVNAEYAILEEK